MSLQANLVKNAGMENGTNNWTAESDATVVSDTTDEHSGSQQLKVTAGATATNVGATQELLFESDQYYTLSSWIQTTSGHDAGIWIDKGDGSPDELVTLSDTTSYTKLSSVFKSVGQAGNVYLRAKNNNDEVYFDDVSIVRLSDTENAGYLLPAKYRSTKHDKGIYITSDDRLTYDNVYGNQDQFSFIARIKPQFEPMGANTSTEERTIFDYCSVTGTTDVDEHCFRLYYDFSGSELEDETTNGTADYDATVDENRIGLGSFNFTVDEYIGYRFTFDSGPYSGNTYTIVDNGINWVDIDGNLSGMDADNDWNIREMDVWRLELSGNNLVSSTTQEFTLDKTLEISGWFKSEGRYYEDDDYYGKLFVNGIEIAALTTQTSGPTNQPNYLSVGGKLDSFSSNLPQIIQQSDSVIDELILFPIALTDDELIGHHTNDEPVPNPNTTRKYSGSLDDHDILTIETATGESELYDASAGTETQATGLSGKPPCIRGNEDEEQILYLKHDNVSDTPKLKIIRNPHFRS